MLLEIKGESMTGPVKTIEVSILYDCRAALPFKCFLAGTNKAMFAGKRFMSEDEAKRFLLQASSQSDNVAYLVVEPKRRRK